METRSKNKMDKRTLPEDRQGPSGATAGGDSGRVGSDHTLNRRTVVGSPERTTAETNTDNAESVLERGNPSTTSTTKAGKVRQRMQWSIEMNSFIMHAYFKITKLETQMIGYRQDLFTLFKEKYPQINVTEQRVADQRRTIVMKNLLPTATIEAIKGQAAIELSQNNQGGSNNDTDHDNNIDIQQINPVTTENITNIGIQNSDNDDTATIEKLKEMYHTTYSEYNGSNPIMRPRLPKINSSSKLSYILSLMNNNIIPDIVEENRDIKSIHTVIYCCAMTVLRFLNIKIHQQTGTKKIISEKRKPKWRIRLEKDIECLRRDAGRLTQFLNNNRKPRLIKTLQPIFAKVRSHTKHEPENSSIKEYLDTIKQKLSVKAGRLKRYLVSQERKSQNELFKANEKIFYRNLNITRSRNGANIYPNVEEFQNYWKSVWSTPTTHNYKASWIKSEEERTLNVEQMQISDLSVDQIISAIKKTSNWKTPGCDGIQNFWYKRFTALHAPLTEAFNKILQDKDEMPEFFTMGITFMKPKNEDTQDPSKYRPITCLPTIYKILSSVLTDLVYRHIEDNNILTEEQKGGRKNYKGCKEQMIIDATVLKQIQKDNRHLHVCYIDYMKAYDSVPHSWLTGIMEIYKVDSKIISFLKKAMNNWNTKLQIRTNNCQLTSNTIDIKRGIFQGDPISGLWFCLALNPLSAMLNNTKYGHKLKCNKTTEYTLSHLLYMDDLKLYAATRSQLEKLINITQSFSDDINMSFGLDKCRTLHIEKGKVISETAISNITGNIATMDDSETYKYLGFQQNKLIAHNKIKQALIKAYSSRTEKILQSKLTSKNTFKAINTYAIPILTYSFGVINWTNTDLESLHRKTRTLFTKYNKHHPRASVERFLLSRPEGGRGMVDLINLHNKQVQNMVKFFHDEKATSQLHKAVTLADNNYTILNLRNAQINNEDSFDNTNAKIEAWAQKELHGRHHHDLNQNYVDKEASNKWLQSGEIYAETEGFMLAIQDQVISTRNYLKFIIKDPTVTNDKCRKCHMSSETIQHIISGCKLLANSDYLNRHNKLANIIHSKLATKYQLLTSTEPYYKYTAEPVLENSQVKIYYDRTILTDKHIPNNRPDITFVDKTKRITYLIDISVPLSDNIQKMISEKLSKYSDLSIEINRLWKMEKTVVVPIVLSSTGVIPKQLHQALKVIELPSHLFITLQKAVILDTCHIVRRFLNETITTDERR